MILAIDPGPVQSAYVLYQPDDQTVAEGHIVSNEAMLLAVEDAANNWHVGTLAIEMVESFGMPVGREVFETVRWSGRFEERFNWLCDPTARVERIGRKNIKLHLCNSVRAKDSNIRQALLDRFGPVGTKAEPGKLYGVKKDIWSALALAVTCADRMGAD